MRRLLHLSVGVRAACFREIHALHKSRVRLLVLSQREMTCYLTGLFHRRVENALGKKHHHCSSECGVPGQMDLLRAQLEYTDSAGTFMVDVVPKSSRQMMNSYPRKRSIDVTSTELLLTSFEDKLSACHNVNISDSAFIELGGTLKIDLLS